MVVDAGRVHPSQTSETPLQMPLRRGGSPNQHWQADLVDMSCLKAANDGTTFLLAVIDVFSKRVWCVPLKSKSAASLVAAFRQLL